MRTGRRGLKELRLGRKTSEPEAIGNSCWHHPGLKPCHKLIKMIAGAGVGIAGGGAGMLRTRRRDISIKPNRKLDRKSSRGMLYENEELRLRTIHINAEVEQGQNDIKKLRRENEQLRREIWSLRDEYDKLEEILKKQKNREESDDPEDRSEDEANGSECWDENENEDEDDDDDDDDDEEDVDDEESGSDDAEDQDDRNQEERLENAENQKISSEKMSNTGPVQHRSRINFDDLSVVDEEEEQPKKEKNKNEEQLAQQVSTSQTNQQLQHCTPSTDNTDPLRGKTFGHYQSDCAFVFPNTESPNGYSNIVPIERSCLLMTPCSQMYSESSSQHPNASLDMGTHNHPRIAHVATPPLPPGWQSSVGALPARAAPLTTSKFPFVSKTQSMTFESHILPSKDSLYLRTPENIGAVENEQSNTKLTAMPSLAERRKAFFKQNTQTLSTYGSVNIDGSGSTMNALDKSLENGIYEEKQKFDKGLNDDERPINGENALPADLLSSDNTPSHFFAPLSAKSKFPYIRETALAAKSIEDGITVRHSDNGNSNSPSSERTASTVVSRAARYNNEKGSADICVNGAVPYNGSNQIEKGDAKAFFSSENLFIAGDAINNGSSNGSSNPLTKSISCQDLSTRLSFTENLKYSNEDHNHAKSENTLDNMSLISKAFRSQLNVTLRPCQSPSPDVPEIPKLPSIDYKLFNNPFLQNFEQAYQNFPVRTEGQSPVTHPLSIQVSESPVSGTKYSSPVRIQPSFSGPSVSAEPDCGTCKRKNLERLRLMIPPAKTINPKGERQEYHVTSFETPSPHTVQIPPMTPYEIETLRRIPTGASPVPQNARLYQNVPFVPRGAAVYCPGQGMRMYYDTTSMKVPAQTQTSIEDEVAETPAVAVAEADSKTPTIAAESGQPTPEPLKKRRSRKGKSGSVKEKRKSQGSQKRKNNQLTKQTSVASKDASESPVKLGAKVRGSEIHEDKNESRSSSSGQESPKKEQTKRVSLYFSAKKRPSLSSVRTSRSRSVENTKDRNLTRDETLEGNTTNSERERTNSISSREAGVKEKLRKASTSSSSVPWCACWGNGCL